MGTTHVLNNVLDHWNFEEHQSFDHKRAFTTAAPHCTRICYHLQIQFRQPLFCEVMLQEVENN